MKFELSKAIFLSILSWVKKKNYSNDIINFKSWLNIDDAENCQWVDHAHMCQ